MFFVDQDAFRIGWYLVQTSMSRDKNSVTLLKVEFVHFLKGTAAQFQREMIGWNSPAGIGLQYEAKSFIELTGVREAFTGKDQGSETLMI